MKVGVFEMIEKDTVKLLRECDAGVKMGVKSIEDVQDHVRDKQFHEILVQCKNEHEELQNQIDEQLTRFGDDGKEPAVMAKGMSWMKSNMKLAMEDSDHTVADLITDGCNMGVKSLNRYLNQYKAADERSKDIAKRLIHLEEQLAKDVSVYL